MNKAKKIASTMSLDNFIRDNYQQAVDMCERMMYDTKMLDAVEAETLGETLALNWLREYEVLQGQDKPREKAVAKVLISNLGALRKQKSCSAAFGVLTQKLIEEETLAKRKQGWISLCSKFVWCCRPQEGVMIDRYVTSALKALEGHLPCLEARKLGRQPSASTKYGWDIDITKAVAFYDNYCSMVQSIATHHADLLAELEQEAGHEYAYDIRIVDKLLWMMGNHNYVLEWALSRE